MVTADDKDCIHYFNNVIILLFYFNAGVNAIEWDFEQLLNWNVAFSGWQISFSDIFNFKKYTKANISFCLKECIHEFPLPFT